MNTEDELFISKDEDAPENDEPKQSAFGYIVAVVLVVLGFVLLLAVPLVKEISGQVKEMKAEMSLAKATETIREGEIVDKIIENGHTVSNGFGQNSYKPTEYIIVVENECEYNDKTFTGTKDFKVSEEVYNNYKVGDWFDSRDLTAYKTESGDTNDSGKQNE